MDQQNAAGVAMSGQSLPNPDLQNVTLPIETNLMQANFVMIPAELLADLVNERRQLRKTNAYVLQLSNRVGEESRQAYEQRRHAEREERRYELLAAAVRRFQEAMKELPYDKRRAINSHAMTLNDTLATCESPSFGIAMQPKSLAGTEG